MAFGDRHVCAHVLDACACARANEHPRSRLKLFRSTARHRCCSRGCAPAAVRRGGVSEWVCEELAAHSRGRVRRAGSALAGAFTPQVLRIGNLAFADWPRASYKSARQAHASSQRTRSAAEKKTPLQAAAHAHNTHLSTTPCLASSSPSGSPCSSASPVSRASRAARMSRARLPRRSRPTTPQPPINLAPQPRAPRSAPSPRRPSAASTVRPSFFLSRRRAHTGRRRTRRLLCAPPHARSLTPPTHTRTTGVTFMNECIARLQGVEVARIVEAERRVARDANAYSRSIDGARQRRKRWQRRCLPDER